MCASEGRQGDVGLCSLYLYSVLLYGGDGNGKFFPGSSLGSLHSIVASSGPAGPVFVKSTTSLLSRLHCCPRPSLTVPDSGNSRGLAAGLRVSLLKTACFPAHMTHACNPNAVDVETKSIKDPRAASAA